MKGHPYIHRFKGGSNFKGKLEKWAPCICCGAAYNHKHHNSKHNNRKAQQEIRNERATLGR